MTARSAPVDDLATAGPAHRSLADHAYEQLRTKILNSRMEPGTALSIPALAQSMNISRSPVREAVQKLIHEGLATHVPHAGAEVARLAIEELVEIYVVKEPLAGLASRLATIRLTQSDVETLQAMVLRQEQALTAETADSVFMAMDLEFPASSAQWPGMPRSRPRSSSSPARPRSRFRTGSRIRTTHACQCRNIAPSPKH